MDDARRTPYPVAATRWMVGEQRARVLDLGSGRGGLAAMLHDAGHEVFGLDRAVEAVAHLADRLGTRLHVAGQVESLPYLSCHFDVVTASQTLHRFAPGLALTEIARVLRPGGHLAVAYNTRDDTVPWVRRLTALMRDADPRAMGGDFGTEAVEALAGSPYFSGLERRNFRNWVPITRSGLVAMAARQPYAAALTDERRARLLADVGELYDSSARSPEPLLLPFQASCWRAEVDHSGLVLVEDEDALEIRL
ncbi:Methyltransferase domain-containing protein [Friedmanniella luteola]|uniref:Methyltransferase domain-containing protein n=1 Tax=Friedmanniella luteola TaxID=546871 RepID=A0A1H1LGQ7_9ACTN|nr:class I SAM-dependent methyltransferase [Friedmanniella luteola]SDR73502.1 Methyltransferase domain-containing protein [Friedmanniella luteola]